MAEPDDRHDEGESVRPPVDVEQAEAAGPTAGEAADIMVLDSGEALARGAQESVLLELEDLLPDASGEVVLFAGEELPVNIVSHEPVTLTGIAEAHVTATGVDVTGLHFYSFEGGITLYSPTDLLIVSDHGAG